MSGKVAPARDIDIDIDIDRVLIVVLGASAQERYGDTWPRHRWKARQHNRDLRRWMLHPRRGGGRP